MWQENRCHEPAGSQEDRPHLEIAHGKTSRFSGLTREKRVPIISFRNVDFSYGDNQVLEDVSFNVYEGATMVVLGASGTGKTTLLRLILGLIKPDAGQIHINGEDIVSMSERELMEVRQQIGVVFQEGALFDSMSVRDNVGFRLIEQNGLTLSEIDEKVMELLDAVELEDIRDAMPDELSGGMKRRVAIARALAGNPRIMLYDEPTTGLDPIVCQTICELIVKLRDRECMTSMVITHDILTAFRVASRFVVLRHGRVIFDGAGDDLMTQQDPYLCRFIGSVADFAYDEKRRTQMAAT